MKRFSLLILAVSFLGAAIFPVDINARKKEKPDREDDAVRAVLYLNGNQGGRTVEGYLLSPMLNDPEYMEISDSPKGERTRYISEDVDSLVIMDSLVYVKRKCSNAGLIRGAGTVRWVRKVYGGRGIDVYCAYFVTATKVNNTTIIETPMNWYVSIADDIAMSVSSQICSSPYYTGLPGVQKTVLSHYFGKIYGYREFASRVKAGEFAGLIDAVKAWEAEYGSLPVNRAEGKIKSGQVGVQSNVTQESASAKVGWKRMKTEQVFPKYARTISAGSSLDVAPWSRHIKHSGTDYRLKVPPVGIYADVCWMDFGRFGSVGYVMGADYSRFGYRWQWDDGYGPKGMSTSCNRFDVEAGLSWHITICRNFEAYVRAMADIAIIDDRTIKSETGEKNSSESKFNTYVQFAAVGGLRWYFYRNVGLYAEGGYDIGYVSAGLTFRF